MMILYNNQYIHINKALEIMKLGDILFDIPLDLELFNLILLKAIHIRNDPYLKYILKNNGFTIISNKNN